MNRYPLWKYLLMLAAFCAALLYTLPNFFGEAPAVQISAVRSSAKVDNVLMQRLEKVLAINEIAVNGAVLEHESLKFRFKDTDTQLKARDLIQEDLGEDYSVALNLISSSPDWLNRLHAKPMALGLDLRGGVHFLLEVDMKAAESKAVEKAAAEVRRSLRQEKIRAGAIRREINEQGEIKLVVLVRDQAAQELALASIKKALPRMQVQPEGENIVTAVFKKDALLQLKEDAVRQNITILHNRVNELGVAEPVIQQQGPGRIVVELPGIQDTAQAKDILGRTATLEVRLVEDEPSRVEAALNGMIPYDVELLDERSSRGENRKFSSIKKWS